jgi:hypothetical protein
MRRFIAVDPKNLCSQPGQMPGCGAAHSTQTDNDHFVQWHGPCGIGRSGGSAENIRPLNHPQFQISIDSQGLCFSIPSIARSPPSITKHTPLRRAVHRVGSIVAIPVLADMIFGKVRPIMDCAARTTERRRRSGCRSRDRRIPRSHRLAGLAGTATSSPPLRCWARPCR